MFERTKQALKNVNIVALLIYTAIAAAVITGSVLAYRAKAARASVIIVAAVIIYAVIMLIISVVASATGIFSKIGTDPSAGPLAGNMTFDLLVKLFMPMVISDEKGHIVWYNKAFGAKSEGNTSLYGKKIDSFSDISFEQIVGNGQDGCEVKAFGELFNVKCYKTLSHGKNYIFTAWDNRTELARAYKILEDENIIFSYIVIDNLDEINKYAQEKSRTAASDVYEVLKSWSDSLGGFIREYEREKYVFIFSAKHLKGLEDAKFDILDKIRDIRIGAGSLPITVSVGMSALGDSLLEKEQSAEAALEMALQRGGDQVVVKDAGGMEFYGGKTKTVQKRAKVHARVVADELVVNMSSSSNVLIMGHKNTDFDSFGACIGMARLAMFCGVKSNIIINAKDPALKKCFDKFKSIPEYRDIFINSFEAQDILKADTFLVIVDVNNPEQFEAPDVAANVRNIAIIDHHRRTSEFDYPLTISHIEPPASSACELVSEILEQALPQGSLAKEEADMLYTGIMLDTKQFTRNVGNRTFGAALYLKNEGASPTDAQNFFKTDISDFVRSAKFESNVVIYKKCIAIAHADSADGMDEDRIAAAKTADTLLSLEGVTASFVLCTFENSVHISARSSGNINVQLILEKIGGGGRFDAAGAKIQSSDTNEVLKTLKSEIDAYFDEN